MATIKKAVVSKAKVPGRTKLICMKCESTFSTHSTNRTKCHKCLPKCTEKHFFQKGVKRVREDGSVIEAK